MLHNNKIPVIQIPCSLSRTLQKRAEVTFTSMHCALFSITLPADLCSHSKFTPPGKDYPTAKSRCKLSLIKGRLLLSESVSGSLDRNSATSLSSSSQAESGGERLFEALPLGSRVLWDPGVLTLLARLI